MLVNVQWYGNMRAYRMIVLFAVVFGLFLPLLAARADESDYKEERTRLVRLLAAQGIKDQRVLTRIGTVPRHLFIPETLRGFAYADSPLPIGEGQTISQPYVVAFMTEALAPSPTDKVLEIGTGSGYQAAVLAPLVRELFTIEIVPSLGERAEQTLQELGYRNVHVKVGDGYQVWPSEAPFDKILLTAAPDKVPQPLIDQLKEGGRLIAPVGTGAQELILLTKVEGKVTRRSLLPVRFVPMTGEAASR